jgi:hypothetical protein
LLPDRNAVDDGGVPADFSHGVSTVSRDAVAEALAAISNCYYALRVAVPRNVVDRLHRIPYAHQTGGITTSNVVSAGREARDGGLGGMAGVLLADFGVVDAPQED